MSTRSERRAAERAAAARVQEWEAEPSDEDLAINLSACGWGVVVHSQHPPIYLLVNEGVMDLDEAELAAAEIMARFPQVHASPYSRIKLYPPEELHGFMVEQIYPQMLGAGKSATFRKADTRIWCPYCAKIQVFAPHPTVTDVYACPDCLAPESDYYVRKMNNTWRVTLKRAKPRRRRRQAGEVIEDA